MNDNKQMELSLIPKTEQYMEYMLNLIVKLPRVEKFSIGNEYKISMYKLIEKTLYLNKNLNTYRNFELLNEIDVLLNCQKIYLRIMYKNYWIDDRKQKIAMEKIYEIGKIIGGLLKYYAQNNKKRI